MLISLTTDTGSELDRIVLIVDYFSLNDYDAAAADDDYDMDIVNYCYSPYLLLLLVLQCCLLVG